VDISVQVLLSLGLSCEFLRTRTIEVWNKVLNVPSMLPEWVLNGP
jgi:hypothetical protein